MAALENHNAGLCYQHEDKEDKMDGVVGVCMLVRPEHSQRHNHTTILTITLNHTSVLQAGLLVCYTPTMGHTHTQREGRCIMPRLTTLIAGHE